MTTSHDRVPEGGLLEMTFRLDNRGRTVLSHLYRRVPIVVQQALYFDEELPTMACVYILSAGGPTLEGDHSRMTILLEPHTMAHISTGAATVVASMSGGRAQMVQRLTLREGSHLEWLPQPLIPSSGADYTTRAEITIDPSATLFWSEVVTCGRLHHGERFAYRKLRSEMQIRRPDGELLFWDNLLLEPSDRSPDEWALMGGFNHFGTVLILAPEEHTAMLAAEISPRAKGTLRQSVATLNKGCGLIVRIVGQETESIVATIRALCSLVRRRVKGHSLPNEFPWRTPGEINQL